MRYRSQFACLIESIKMEQEIRQTLMTCSQTDRGNQGRTQSGSHSSKYFHGSYLVDINKSLQLPDRHFSVSLCVRSSSYSDINNNINNNNNNNTNNLKKFAEDHNQQTHLLTIVQSLTLQ